MSNRSRRGVRLLAVAITAGLIGIGVFAYAAANTVPATKAGDGAGAITGYVITNVSYNLNGTNPGNIDSVTFDMDTAPAVGSTVMIKLVQAGTDWYTCGFAGVAVTCPTTAPQATVLAADELRVIAVN